MTMSRVISNVCRVKDVAMRYEYFQFFDIHTDADTHLITVPWGTNSNQKWWQFVENHQFTIHNLLKLNQILESIWFYDSTTLILYVFIEDNEKIQSQLAIRSRMNQFWFTIPVKRIKIPDLIYQLRLENCTHPWSTMVWQ